MLRGVNPGAATLNPLFTLDIGHARPLHRAPDDCNLIPPRRSAPAAHLRDHFPPRRRENHADGEFAAGGRGDPARRRGPRPRRAAPHPLRLDENRARAWHFGHRLGDDL